MTIVCVSYLLQMAQVTGLLLQRRLKVSFSGKVRNAGGDESQLLSCSVLSSAAAAAEEEYLTCNDN